MESGAKNIFFNLWNKLIPEFRKEINHISESFLGALGDNYESIMTLIDTRFESGIFNPSDPLNVVSGTFIIDDFVFTVQLEQKNQLVNGSVFGFTKDGIPMSFYVIIDNDITEWISNSCQSKLPAEQIVAGIWAIAVFKKYAEVETIIVPPLQRKKFKGVKRVNDTKLNICYLDSKWFRNIIRIEDFNVRGHLRFQPFGKGRAERRPIWISAFVKHGYASHARKQIA